MAPRSLCLTCMLVLSLTGFALADEPTYRLPDPQIAAVTIDSDATESFLGIHLDTTGRLFVGGREGLFVYEPNSSGGYGPRQLLVRFANHTWVYDIAIRGNDLYVSTVSAIYLIPDAVTKREGLTPRRIIWGIPFGHVHQCFHDLDFGPEGDLYFSTGDPLTGYGDFHNRADHWGHWTWFCGPDNTKVEYNGVGGVFHVRPDGSNLKVVSHGTRNNVGLTFDSHWNLFTNDNDHESLPADYVPGRLLHVTPHAYFSWPRGWMPSKQPHRPDLLETMNDHLGRYVPVGEVDYEDAYLPAKYRHSLLVDRWGEHKLVYCPIEPRGASFKAEEHDLLLCRGDARPVGVAVGRGGRIFVTVCYMPANDSSPTYRSDIVMITRADDPGTHPFAGYDITKASVQKLYAELHEADWSRRHNAHEEILRRGGDALAEAPAQLGRCKPQDPATASLVWLVAASSSPDSGHALEALSTSPDADTRLQAINALAAFPTAGAIDHLFLKALNDKDPRIQLAGILAYFDRPASIPPAILDGPARSGDSYLRQAATMLIAQNAPLPQIQSLCQSPDAATRLAGLLAAGFRLTMPPTFGPVPDDLKLDDQAQAFSYTITTFYQSPPVDLRKLGRVGNYTMAQWWKQARHTDQQEQLFAVLEHLLGDPDKQVRFEAAFFLNLLNDPRTQPRLAQIQREYRPASLGPRQAVTEAWLAGPFPDQRRMFELSQPPEQGPIDLAAQYAVGTQSVSWKRLSQQGDAFRFDRLLRPMSDCSFYAYFRMESAKSQPAVLWIGSQQQVRIWQNGRQVWDNWAGRNFHRADDRIDLTLQGGSNDFLIRVHGGRTTMLSVDYEAAQPVHLTLPDQLDSQTLAKRLAEAKGADVLTEIPPQFAKIDWTQEYKRGNRAHGHQLFDSLGCSKCHAISNDAPGGGGPSLADAGKRFTVQYVVESILLPNKVVSPLFRWTVLRLNDGQVFNGLVIDETADKIDMRMPDTTLKTFSKSAVSARRQEDHSPMPQGLVRTPEELRDLLAFVLASDP